MTKQNFEDGIFVCKSYVILKFTPLTDLIYMAPMAPPTLRLDPMKHIMKAPYQCQKCLRYCIVGTWPLCLLKHK